MINRQFNFNVANTSTTTYSFVNSNQLQLSWQPSLFPGAEMFDVEYTFIDKHTAVASSLDSTYNSGGYFSGVSQNLLDKLFKNNSTRITTAGSSTILNLAYDSGYLLYRVRGVQIKFDDGIRYEGNWNYQARTGSDDCSPVVKINGHEQNLNWQFSVAFAEEGKHKDVISYFDGSLRNRQSVTISNTENKSIVQETIYDALGRPAATILPAPTTESNLHYFRRFNINSSGVSYSFSDLSYNGCFTSSDRLSSDSGSSRNNSPANPFLNSLYNAKYIPNSNGFPLAVTEYMADNTGRIKAQGGVGDSMQLGTGHETKYFYGKPTQTELDRLFGTEAGNASHYLKNMVIDANKQVSVSYVNASGQTIATALAGLTPPNLYQLASNNEEASVRVSNDIITASDFSIASGSSLQANATFLAPVPGLYKFGYQIDPLQYSKLYGQLQDSSICSDCYYDLEIRIKNACDSLLKSQIVPAGSIFDTTCVEPQSIQDSLSVEIRDIGEYYVSYKLTISKDALNFYDSVHFAKNSKRG